MKVVLNTKEDKRDIKKEFLAIFSYEDCDNYKGDAEKSGARLSYSKAINSLNGCYEHINRGFYYKRDKYPYEKFDMPKETVDYCNALIEAFKTALIDFTKTGTYNFKNPTGFSAEAVEIYNSENDYVDYQTVTIEKKFKSMTKNLVKNGFDPKNFKSSNVSDGKVPEVSSERTESYDSNRMSDYKPLSKGEQLAQSKFLSKRYKHFGRIPYFFKDENNQKIVKEFYQKLFNAIDNAWFDFASGKTESVDFTEINEINNSYRKDYPIIDKYEGKFYGYRTDDSVYSCFNDIRNMEKNRKKVVGEITGKTEDTYKIWEKSVDAILNENGKPSLNAFLDNWVTEMVAYFTNKKNVKSWEDTDTLLTTEIKELETKIKAYEKNWEEMHRNDPNLTSWRDRMYGYERESEYQQMEASLKVNKSFKADNGNKLSIARLGKTKITALFREQADAVKKEFVTRVCTEAGPLTSGVFYWGEGGHMNGDVHSDLGHFRLTSFFAGGWNIQRLHVRVKITKLTK